MDKLVINGSRKLAGEIEVHGSKNSVLPILAACVLSQGVNVIHNCPMLSDVDAAVKILTELGCKVKREGHTVSVDSDNITSFEISDSLMREMRSSVIFLGAILGRTGKAVLSTSVGKPGYGIVLTVLTLESLGGDEIHIHLLLTEISHPACLRTGINAPR